MNVLKPNDGEKLIMPVDANQIFWLLETKRAHWPVPRKRLFLAHLSPGHCNPVYCQWAETHYHWIYYFYEGRLIPYNGACDPFCPTCRELKEQAEEVVQDLKERKILAFLDFLT